MKKLLIVLFSIGLAYGASAQKVMRGGGGGIHYSRPPRVIVGVGAGFGYSPFYPYGGFYSPWGFPPYAGAYGYSRPSRLDLEIQDIKLDYNDRIKSIRMDDSMTGKQKRQKVRELKTERDKAINQAKKDYYYKRSRSTKPYSNDDNSNNNNYNDSSANDGATSPGE